MRDSSYHSSMQDKQMFSRGGEKKVMKKSLSVLLSAAIAFGAFASVASAATPTTALEKFEALKAAGIFSGVGASQDPALASKMTRAELARILDLLKGLDVDTKPTTQSFSDVKSSHWAFEEIEAAKAAGLVVGVGGGKFDPNGNVTVQQIAVAAANVLGLKAVAGATVAGADSWAAGYIQALLDNGINLPTTYKAAATRETLVTATYSVYEALNPAVVAVSSFAQSGSKTLTVKFSKAVDKAVTFAVKRDGTTVNIADVKWNDAKTEATLTASFALQTGAYTVAIKGDGIDLTANANGVAAKVSKIEFLGDKGVITDSSIATADKQGLRTTIKISNQYGEDVTSSITSGDLQITASKGGLDSYDKGAIVIKDGTSVDSTKDYVVDQKVVVTVVHTATGTVATQTLTVVQAANVASIELGAITTDDADLKAKPVNVSNVKNNFNSYYIPFTAKDQYGNVLKKADLASLTIISSNTKILKVDTNASNILEIGAEKKTAIKVLATDATETNGTVVLTVVAPNGTNANKTLEVLADPKVDVLTLESPSTQLKKTVKTQLAFSAVDQFGKALVSDADLASTDLTVDNVLNFTDGTKINITGGTIEAGVDYGNKNARTISITPNADTVVLTVITANNKVQNVTWSVAAAPAATAIKGINPDVYKLIQQGQTSVVNAGDVQLIDQYGDGINLPAGWKVTVAADDGTYDNVTASVYGGGSDLTTAAGSKVTFSATAPGGAKGTETVSFTLKDAANKEVDVYKTGFESVALADISTFQLANVDKVYTGGTAAGLTLTDYDRAITLEGLKGNAKVKVDQGLMAAQTITSGLAINGGKVQAPATAINTDGADKTATLSVVVDANGGAQTLTKTVTYNSAAPAVATVKVLKKSDDSEITAPVFVTTASLNGKKIGPVGADADFYFQVKDQYGVVYDDNLSYAITSKDLGAGNDVSIAANGTVTVTGAQVPGKSFQVTIVSQNGITKTVKVIFGA